MLPWPGEIRDNNAWGRFAIFRIFTQDSGEPTQVLHAKLEEQGREVVLGLDRERLLRGVSKVLLPVGD